MNTTNQKHSQNAVDILNYEKRIYYCLVCLVVISVTTVLYLTSQVCIPFMFSFFIYAAISPLLELFEKKLKIRRGLSVAVVALLFVLIFGLLILLLSSSIREVIQSASIYRSKLQEFVLWGSKFLGDLGLDINREFLIEEVQNLPLFRYARNLTGEVFSFFGNSTLIMIFVIFMLVGGTAEPVKNKLIHEVQQQISKYTRTKILISLVTGILSWVVFTLFGLDLSLLFAVLTFLLNFIPTFGSIIAVILPLPVVILQFGFGIEFGVIVGFCAVTQFMLGNILEPKLLGESMDLHPITVLLFLVFWGYVWGIVGMFLAVPVTAVVKVVLSRLEPSRTLANLMAGRLPKDSPHKVI